MKDTSQILVFDRARVRQNRDRAAAGFASHSALFEETAALLGERLGDVKREFQAALDLGAHDGALARQLSSRVPFVVASDLSSRMARYISGPGVVSDEEFLPFAPASFDLVVSNLNLHWVNDLPGALVQIKNALKPGGLFLAAMPGGDTLFELRTALMEAELAVTGGAGLRLSPTIAMNDASALLQRAGFALPVVDCETITLSYSDAFALMRDLRGMGAANVHRERPRRFIRRQILLEAARIYQARFGDKEGRIPATFEILFLHGWRDAVAAANS